MTEHDDSALHLALRSIQLPLPISAEPQAVDALKGLASSSDLTEDEFALILKNELAAWRQHGNIGDNLRASVAVALDFASPILNALDSRTYFRTYHKLRTGGKDVAGLNHQVAVRLLSRYALIVQLIKNELFSCSQIARLLQATEEGINVPYGPIAVLARELKIQPTLDAANADAPLWNRDADLSERLFPDASRVESCEIAAEQIQPWAPEGNMESLLSRLCEAAGTSNEPFWPYLQMLHWCLTPIEFYDHPATYLYEFSPRGQVAMALFSRYPTATGNPVLNNAKAVESVNHSWARNRGGDQAHALVELLRLVEALPYVGRKQVARILRSWLIRIIELMTIEVKPIRTVATPEMFALMSDHIARSETFTRGVIEQRVVDCVSALAFEKEGWRPRGLGDGVHASNLTRKKLGDVEFANVDAREAIAIEAHGGHLSTIYVKDHQRSLARIIDRRLRDSWNDLDDASAWHIKILFVSHSRAETEFPTNEIIHGVSVSYDYLDYFELINLAVSTSTPQERAGRFQSLVIDVLNRPNVRQIVRDKFKTLLNERFCDELPVKNSDVLTPR
ncbi:hypothetical protein M3D92_09760 [Micrococcus terreus]|uniref:hypothetical protein n=1 Tax=Micrococcus terreus TaxID=574650 RepID=UPI0021A8A617|nr:hypothetical protein [Micrococcus terreus]MCT2089575.1 hypothetical protein [Micrococcus terreus]